MSLYTATELLELPRDEAIVTRARAIELWEEHNADIDELNEVPVYRINEQTELPMYSLRDLIEWLGY